MPDARKRAEEFLSEPPPDNGTHGMLDEEEVTTLVRDLLTENTALEKRAEEAEKQLRWNREKDYCDEKVQHYQELLDKVTKENKRLWEVVEKVREQVEPAASQTNSAGHLATVILALLPTAD